MFKKSIAAKKATIEDALQKALNVEEGKISILNLSRKVAGKMFNEQFPHNPFLTIGAVRAALEALPEAHRQRIDLLDLSYNHLLRYDLHDIATLLPLLPNVSEIALVCCSLTTTRPDFILPFTRCESLRRFYLFDTELGMACAAELYNNPEMEERDVAKMLFVSSREELEKGYWMAMTRPEHHNAIRAAHIRYFDEMAALSNVS